ncbi:MAG: GTP-binding protein [Pseudomonadota bacterium]
MQPRDNRDRRPDRIPVLVIAGFLGAGKTTFLNKLVGQPALQKAMVIVNEFGDEAFDGLFLQEAANAGDGIIIEELTSGCLCCTLQGPLVQTLEDLLRARDNGRIAPFEVLIIETTGLAEPEKILGAFANHPYLKLRYLVGGIVTVADAAQGTASESEHPEVPRQIAVADVLAVSKSDLVEKEALSAFETDLRQLNPVARISPVQDLIDNAGWINPLLAQASIAVSLSPAEHENVRSHGNEKQSSREHAHAHEHTHGHAHGHDHAHAHDHAHDHHGSIVLTSMEPMSEQTVSMFMDLLGMNLPGELLRVKGIVWISTSTDRPRPWAVHAAGTLQHPLRPLDSSLAEVMGEPSNRIVVITKTDQSTRIRELFDACLRHQEINQPAA